MKRTIFISILSIVSMGISAQNLVTADMKSTQENMTEERISDISPEDSVYVHAEELFQRFFTMSVNPTIEKPQTYDTLLEAFMNYVKSIDTADEERLTVIKEKIRKMRPFMEEAGVYYSQAGKNALAYEYIKCFLNIPMLPIFEGDKFMRSNNYPSLVLFAATEAYNARELEEAVTYFQEYIDLGEKHRQETCYTFLAISLNKLERHDYEGRVLEEGLMNYPDNMDMLRLFINYHYRKKNMDKAKELLEYALTLSPNDRELLFSKANYLETDGKFLEAADIYKKLQIEDSGNVIFIEKQALCYYNMGSSLINESNKQTDGAEMKRLRDEATKNYNFAIPLLKDILKSEPNNTTYIAALADAYSQTGNMEAAAGMRKMLTVTPNNPGLTHDTNNNEIPNFNDWALASINEELDKWAQKDPYETTEEYTKRVNSESRIAKALELRKKAEADFIARYSGRFDTENMTLKPYDADHGTYKIQTRQGAIYLQVPREEDKAKNFQKQWNSVRTENPKFAIDKDGNMVLSELIFIQGDGTSYFYDARKDLSYEQTKVTVQFDDFSADDMGKLIGDGKLVSKNDVTKVVTIGESDVDLGLDKIKNKNLNENTCALIICNEEYKNTENVEFAKNDGNSFYNYCMQILGIPGKNIYMQDNATGGDIDDKLYNVESFIKSRNGDARVIVYYSGHGLPDPSTGEAYILPTDASPRTLRSCRKLSDIYAQLCKYPSQSVTVFIDACFSGAKRDGAMMDTAARGVAIKSRPAVASGNMVIFTACTGDETAYPFKAQKHGMFTYFLLKKLKETKGSASYKELADYIKKEVSRNSLDINNMSQTPTITSSTAIEDVWGKWRLDREK